MTPVELERELQTLEGFQQWLETSSLRIVGQARRDRGCPLYTFLSERLDQPLQVAFDGFAIGDGRARHTPLSYAFIREIDDGRSDNQPVTLAQAKRALKVAKKKTEGGAV